MRHSDLPNSFDTPPKRARLEGRRNPYWTSISGRRGGLSLGYRKSTRRPGTWVAKVVVWNRRFEESFATADDHGAPQTALSYGKAVSWAFEWARQKAALVDAERTAGVEAQAPTVGSVCKEYIRQRTGELDGRTPKTGIGKHVLPDEAFSAIRLERLTAQDIKEWRDRLKSSISKSSINRVMNDLRAALNAAIDTHHAVLPSALRERVKVGTRSLKAADVARKQILQDETVDALVGAAFAVDPDFGLLVAAEASTGSRFSQLARMSVRALQMDGPRLLVPVSRKGRGEKECPSTPVVIGRDVADLLYDAARERGPDEPLLMRWERRQTGPFTWEKVGRVPWKPSTTATYWRKTLTAAGLPSTIVMYAFRHTSIVRCLRAGLPIRLVAAMHDTSSGQIEKYYSAYITEITEELQRRAVRPLIEQAPVAAFKVAAE